MTGPNEVLAAEEPCLKALLRNLDRHFAPSRNVASATHPNVPAGAWTARRASRVDPIESVRGE